MVANGFARQAVADETAALLSHALPYDSLDYVRTLTYLGQPEVIPGLPWPVILRPIPGSDRLDALGPWPYASPPGPEAAGALEILRARGIVTLTAFLRPDQPANLAGLERAGFTCVRLKDHFVYDAAEPLPERSAKTRYNLSAARRRWSVAPIDLAGVWPRVAQWHHALVQRRSMSRIAAVDAHHFEQLSQVPGVVGLGAFAASHLAAVLLVVRTRHTIHFHAVAGDEQAYTDRAFYALYDDVLQRWGPHYRLHLGGVPGGVDGPGIERFKRRFATSTRPVMLIKAVLDPATCADLAARQGQPGFFPPYRTPAD